MTEKLISFLRKLVSFWKYIGKTGPTDEYSCVFFCILPIHFSCPLHCHCPPTGWRSIMSTKKSLGKSCECHTIQLVFCGQDGLDAVLWRPEEPQFQGLMDSWFWNPNLEKARRVSAILHEVFQLWPCVVVLPSLCVKLSTRSMLALSRILSCTFSRSAQCNVPRWDPQCQCVQFLWNPLVGLALEAICYLWNNVNAEQDIDFQANLCLLAGDALWAHFGPATISCGRC